MFTPAEKTERKRNVAPKAHRVAANEILDGLVAYFEANPEEEAATTEHPEAIVAHVTQQNAGDDDAKRVARRWVLAYYHPMKARGLHDEFRICPENTTATHVKFERR